MAFYATRDTDPARWFPQGKKFNDLPGVYHANVDVDTPPYQRRPNQRPQLTDAEIDDIVAFLYTLTDGYKTNRSRSVVAPRQSPAQSPVPSSPRGDY